MRKISIVTIVYNDSTGLEKTIKSVVNQTFHDYEYIIIDGGSTDGSVDIIMRYESHIDYWVSESDKGIYNAMNKGLEHCHGEWSFFLNSGDVFCSNNVLRDIDFDGVSEQTGAIYGRYKFYSRYDKLLLNEVRSPFFESKKRYRGMGFSHQSVFVRTTFARRFPFDESFRLCADYNMMMRIYEAGYSFQRIETIIAICDGRGGTSMNNRFIQDKEIARVCGCEYNLRPFVYRNIKRLIRPCYRFLKKRNII